VISRSGVKFKYRAMTDSTCELVWIQDILSELHLMCALHMRLYCYNNVAIHIAEKSIFHERPKHIEGELSSSPAEGYRGQR